MKAAYEQGIYADAIANVPILQSATKWGVSRSTAYHIYAQAARDQARKEWRQRRKANGLNDDDI